MGLSWDSVKKGVRIEWWRWDQALHAWRGFRGIVASVAPPAAAVVLVEEEAWSFTPPQAPLGEVVWSRLPEVRADRIGPLDLRHARVTGGW